MNVGHGRRQHLQCVVQCSESTCTANQLQGATQAGCVDCHGQPLSKHQQADMPAMNAGP